MNIWDFVIYQQLMFPEECGMLFLFLCGWLFWSGILIFIILLVHGWPTQGVFWSHTEAPQTPSRQYLIKGTLKEEAGIRRERSQRFQQDWSRFVEWVRDHPKEATGIALAVMLMLLLWMVLQ